MDSKQLICAIGVFIIGSYQTSSAEVIPGTDLSVNFESANIVGSGRHLNMQRVPVINVNTGQTTLYDVSFKFTYSPADGFTFNRITSVAVSPPTAVANIMPGIYKSPYGYCYVIEGPTMLNTNRSVYTMRGFFEENYRGVCSINANRFTSQIVSGSASGHPDIGHRDIVPNLKDSYTYGYIASDSSQRDHISLNFEQNELLGLRQSGDQLIIGLFSEGVDNSGKPNDFVEPVETAILTKVNQ